MRQANSGKSGSVRVETLDATDLSAMEKHGQREDASGQARRVSDDEPLVHGGLDIVARREKHVEGRKQQGKTKAMHALVQFPKDLIPNGGMNQRAMLGFAVNFINDFYGGDAVFAARLDRDEKGTHKVDVFFLPRWDFEYKDGRKQARCGVGQYTKKAARDRFGKEDRRAQGSALQDALFEYLRDDIQIPGIMPPERKKTTAKDRLEPEAYALEQEQGKVALQRIRTEEEAEDSRQQVRLASRALEREKADLQERERLLLEKERNLEKASRILIAAKLKEGQPISKDLEWADEHLHEASKSRDRQRQRQRVR